MALYDHRTESLRKARARLLRELIDDVATDPARPVFLSGHFHYRAYPFSELGVPLMAFFRELVERVPSLYPYFRLAQREGRPLRQFVLEARRAADLQSRLLAGNRYGRSGWARVPCLGRRGSPPAEVERVDPETREPIASWNSRDVELYRVASAVVGVPLGTVPIDFGGRGEG